MCTDSRSRRASPASRTLRSSALYDADGLELLAPEGVHWAVDDDSIAIVTAFLKSGKELDDGTSVGVQAKSEGTTSLTMTVPGLQRTLGIDVATK